MKAFLIPLGFALGAVAGAMAAPEVPAPATAASTLAAGKQAARKPSAAEARDKASEPGELRPEHPVIAQIKLPLGRTPPPPVESAAQLARHRKSAAAGGIDDAPARCQAQASPLLREACLRRLHAQEKAD